MIDYFEELFDTLKQNKLRVIMTGFSVAWGIFMLLLLLGSGKGLQNGMEFNFSDISKNAIWIWSGETSEAHEGLSKGRRIHFTNEDYEMLKRELQGIDNISGRMYLWGSAPLTYNNNFGQYSVQGVMPDFFNIEILNIIDGRVLNDFDVKNSRKVIILSKPIVKLLFEDEDPMGKFIKVGGIPFRVVGVYQDLQQGDQRRAFIPISTGQRIFSGSNRLNNIAVTTTSTSVAENKQIEEEIRAALARRHRFAVTDMNALHIWNTLESFSQAQGVFIAIRLFVWIIGTMTIIAGIVGVSNIMIILVKERTKEIGIRKAIGASPGSIIRLVLSESLFITTVSGFFGLLAGMGVLHIASTILSNIAAENPTVNHIFMNPSADFGVAIAATVVLILSGLIAGFVPARKATAIKPIEALHDE